MSALRSATRSAGEPLGVALVGCGRIAEHHLAAIDAQPALARLVALADRDLDAARRLAARHGEVPCVTDLEQVLRMDAVDAVILATPNALHCEQAIEAIGRGRHVLVEKPMADSLADAQRMASAAETSGAVLAIAQSFRHGPPMRYLQDHRAEFGQLRSIEISHCVFWDGPQTPWWRDRAAAQGLILPMFAPHALDFVQLAMHDDPIRVHIEAARHQRGWRGEDEVMILMAFPGRRMAQIHLSYNQQPMIDRRIACFDRGVLRIEDSLWLYWNDELRVQPPAAQGNPRTPTGRSMAGFFHTQLAEFVAAVRGEAHRSVLHADGVRLIRTLETLIRLAREQCSGAID
jgi:predicted dehydrogenase